MLVGCSVCGGPSTFGESQLSSTSFLLCYGMSGFAVVNTLLQWSESRIPQRRIHCSRNPSCSQPPARLHIPSVVASPPSALWWPFSSLRLVLWIPGSECLYQVFRRASLLAPGLPHPACARSMPGMNHLGTYIEHIVPAGPIDRRMNRMSNAVADADFSSVIAGHPQRVTLALVLSCFSLNCACPRCMMRSDGSKSPDGFEGGHRSSSPRHRSLQGSQRSVSKLSSLSWSDTFSSLLIMTTQACLRVTLSARSWTEASHVMITFQCTFALGTELGGGRSQVLATCLLLTTRIFENRTVSG